MTATLTPIYMPCMPSCRVVFPAGLLLLQQAGAQGEMGKGKVSGEVVVLLLLVVLPLYICFMLLGIQFGRLVEREAQAADNSGGDQVTWRGAHDYVAKVIDPSIISSTIAMAPATCICIIYIHQLHIRCLCSISSRGRSDHLFYPCIPCMRRRRRRHHRKM